MDSPIYASFLAESPRYQDLEKIDEGGAKSIYAVFDQQTSRPVAMAQLKNLSERKDYEHFLSEAFLTATLEHPNIIPLYDTGLNDKLEPYFTMKLIEGKNLREHILQAKEGNLENHTTQDIIDIFLKICDAIAFAHSKNIIHLDLKPENALLSAAGLQLADFGLSAAVDDIDDTELQMVGTSMYVARKHASSAPAAAPL